MQYGFYFDATRCIGCNACAIACKDWNDIQPAAGVAWRHVTSVESGTVPSVRLVNLSTSCNHCDKPACLAVCPAGAITKREQDGIVVVDQAKCIGCKVCLAACPWGVPQFGASGKMQKCNLCIDKVDAGKVPECVSSCTGGALFAGPLNELKAKVIKKPAVQLEGTTGPSYFITKAG